MKVVGEYRLLNIGLRHWQRLATELRLDDAKLIDRIMAMAHAMPDQAAAIQEQIAGEELSHVTITRLCKRLEMRAVACQKLLLLSSFKQQAPGRIRKSLRRYKYILARNGPGHFDSGFPALRTVSLLSSCHTEGIASRDSPGIPTRTGRSVNASRHPGTNPFGVIDSINTVRKELEIRKKFGWIYFLYDLDNYDQADGQPLITSL